jgi:predicted transcriptional regulator of viral defense system
LPSRAGHIPTHQERTALNVIRNGGDFNVENRPSKTTIRRIIEKGWLERISLGQNQYRITTAGEAALKAKIPM